MVKYPNSPATEETKQACILLRILSEAGKPLSYVEVDREVPAVISMMFGEKDNALWPPFMGTGVVYADLEREGSIERKTPGVWAITEKGVANLASREERFLSHVD